MKLLLVVKQKSRSIFINISSEAGHKQDSKGGLRLLSSLIRSNNKKGIKYNEIR